MCGGTVAAPPATSEDNNESRLPSSGGATPPVLWGHDGSASNRWDAARVTSCSKRRRHARSRPSAAQQGPGLNEGTGTSRNRPSSLPSRRSPPPDRLGMLGKRQRSGSYAEEAGEQAGGPQIATGTARTPEAVSRPCSHSPEPRRSQPPACARLELQRGAMAGRSGPGPSLQGLPDACLIAIFSGLTPLERRTLVPLVCKRWRQLFRNSPPLWRQARSPSGAFHP